MISESSLPLSQALSVREGGVKRGCMSADFMLPLLLNATETDDTRCFFIKRTCPPELSPNKPHFSYIEILEGQRQIQAGMGYVAKQTFFSVFIKMCLWLSGSP